MRFFTHSWRRATFFVVSGFCGFVSLGLRAQAQTTLSPTFEKVVTLHPRSVSKAEPHGVVASASKIASDVGAQILRQGGNAVDAGVAVALALAVTYPQAGNLGGGGFMLVRMADGRATMIDYREVAPQTASATMYQDKNGTLIPEASTVGYKAAGVPGTVAGMALALKMFGTMSWATVVEPARHLAAEGFPVSAKLAQSLRTDPNLPRFAESRRIFQRNGDFYKVGEVFKQPELAETLQRIRDKGAAEFYTGETARRIAADMAAHGGLITATDLAEYHAVAREPLHGTYRGYDILTVPPPSSGGIALIEMLNLLENYPPAKLDTTNSYHRLIEVMRRAFADRSEFPGDPDFVSVPVKGLTDKRYAKKLAAQIDLNHATPSATIGHGEPTVYESPQTTHFSVVDWMGNAVSNTYTLNLLYGSGATVTGAGFLLNDEMDDFAAKVGEPNAFGLIQGAKNAIAPRKRPLSSMTPTLVLKDGKLLLAVGSPGGPTIINSVLQVILNVLDGKMSLADAVKAPRIHHQWLPDILKYEPEFSGKIRAGLIGKGHKLEAVKAIGDVEAVTIDPKTGQPVGASDPRSADAGVSGE